MACVRLQAMAQQIAVSPLRQRQGGGVYVGNRRIAPGEAGRQLRPNEIPPHDCPYFCPFCKHCKKVKHLLNNDLVQLPLGPEAYYDKLRRQAAREEARAEARAEVQEEARAEVQEEARAEVQEEARAEVQEEARAEVQEEARAEEAEGEAQDIREEEQQQERRQLPEVVDADLRNVLGDIVDDGQEAQNLGADNGEEAAQDLPAGNGEEAAANNSGRIVPHNRSENLHTPPSSFMFDVNVPVNTARGVSMDFEGDYVATPAVINRVPDITPPPPKRCHKNCRCCVPSCPCSKNPSDIPVLQARCICRCHKKVSKSASPAKSKVNSPAAAATGSDTFNLPGPSSPKRNYGQLMRGIMDQDQSGSFEDVPQKRAKSYKIVEVKAASKGKKRQRTLEEESTLQERSFKRFAPEAVAKSLGDVNFENISDGSKVPIALRCLGFKRIPEIISDLERTSRKSYTDNNFMSFEV
ncbi:hypothetical protein JTE90_018778 [Oedothorax gibbosus]|uniref:Uncharacterized protein n=1 Tax=Oedothorax gibbosus TaxID=931172 RepID=A0AAV6TKQ3_9ARAC|nr:hypothetical protein JTE90_018778 [Oedothorax gibbosus]